jgi:hypothetical protein
MSRLRWLVIAVCLVLGACDGVRGRPWTAACDYLDSIRLGGVTYEVADHGVGRAIGQRDLGPVAARITGNPPTSGDCLSYRPKDGTRRSWPRGRPSIGSRAIVRVSAWPPATMVVSGCTRRRRQPAHVSGPICSI